MTRARVNDTREKTTRAPAGSDKFVKERSVIARGDKGNLTKLYSAFKKKKKTFSPRGETNLQESFPRARAAAGEKERGKKNLNQGAGVRSGTHLLERRSE